MHAFITTLLCLGFIATVWVFSQFLEQIRALKARVNKLEGIEEKPKKESKKNTKEDDWFIAPKHTSLNIFGEQ